MRTPLSSALAHDSIAASAPKNDPPTGDPKKDELRRLAREKLEFAQRELAHGKYAQVRKMCEELYNPAYGIQEDVLRLVARGAEISRRWTSSSSGPACRGSRPRAS